MAMWFDTREAGFSRQIRRVVNREAYNRAFGLEAAEFMLPRKTSKEKHGEPYLKPTQVDEENIQRRSSEGSLRNSAN